MTKITGSVTHITAYAETFWRGSSVQRKCVFELTTPQCHRGIFQQFWSTDKKINFSTTVSILESPTIKSSVPGHGYFFKPEQFESLPCGKGEPYMEYKRMSCQERNGQLCKFCEKDETTSAPLPTRRPYPDNGKLPNFHYLSWSATPTNGREPEDFKPRAQIKQLFEESELVSGDSEAIRKFFR